MILAGVIHPPRWNEAPAPSVAELWQGRLETPTPTPTPRSQPSPAPQAKNRVLPSPQAIATRVVKPVASGRPPVVIPTSRTTDSPGIMEASPGAVGLASPAAST